LGKEYRPFSSSLCTILLSPVTSSLLGPNILLSTIFSNTISLRFFRDCNTWQNYFYNLEDTVFKLLTTRILAISTSPFFYVGTHYFPIKVFCRRCATLFNGGPPRNEWPSTT
jgi:hypothetical protein